MVSVRILLGSVVLLTSAAVSAGVYRWVDTEGHVHYTDKAVPNSEPVNVHTGHVKEVDQAAAAAAASSGTVTGDQLTQKKADCEQKKRQYVSYINATKVVETDSLGRKHEYTTEEQKQLVQKAQQDMMDVCGAAGVNTSDVTKNP